MRENLTGISLFYTGIVHKVLLDQRERAWVERELAKLRSEIRDLKIAYEKTVATQCWSHLFALRLHVLNRRVKDLKSTRDLFLTNAGPLRHSTVLLTKSSNMKSPRFSPRMHETLNSLSIALHRVQKAEGRVHEGVGGASVLRKRRCEKKVAESTSFAMEYARLGDKFPKELRKQKKLCHFKAHLLGC